MKILIIGCGKMGSAMLSSWLLSGTVTHAVAVDHKPICLQNQFSSHLGRLQLCPTVKDLPDDLSPDLIVLAVKPQQMPDVLSALAPRLKPEWPILTIAAGLRIEFYARHLPGSTIIRAMPNTPTMVGKGMTAATSSKLLSTELKVTVEKLLRATGDFFWVENEDQLDAVMAVSGSGPAYFFYLAEQMAQAGEAMGLTAEQAMRLARQTLVGSGALAETEAGPMSQLRENVTSPGGTTAAAIAVWEKDSVFGNLIAEGLRANVQRGKELAQS